MVKSRQSMWLSKRYFVCRLLVCLMILGLMICLGSQAKAESKDSVLFTRPQCTYGTVTTQASITGFVPAGIDLGDDATARALVAEGFARLRTACPFPTKKASTPITGEYLLVVDLCEGPPIGKDYCSPDKMVVDGRIEAAGDIISWTGNVKVVKEEYYNRRANERQAAVRRAQEETIRVQEAVKRAQEEAARRAQEETRRAQEETRRAQEEAARRAQEKAARQAQEDTRRAQEEAAKMARTRQLQAEELVRQRQKAAEEKKATESMIEYARP